MFFTRLLALPAAMSALVLFVAGPPPALPTERTRYVLTDREAFLFVTPELVASPNVTEAVWSPDGRYVLAARRDERLPPSLTMPLQDEVSLVLWRRSTRRPYELWKKVAPRADLGTIAWLPGNGVGLVEARWIEKGAVLLGKPAPDEGAPEPSAGAIREVLLRIDAVRLQVGAIANLEPQEHLFASPAQPWAVLWNRYGQTIRVVRAGGAVGPVIRLSKVHDEIAWARDGGLLFRGWADPPNPGSPPVVAWYRFDPATGGAQVLSTAPESYQPATARLPLYLKPSTLAVKEGGSQARVQPLWLESVTKTEQPRALLCGDSDRGQLAPDGGAALYVSQGAAWVMPFLRLPREQFMAARRAALQQVAVSNARQLGLGLMMYLQDYDEVYPPADGAINDRLLPYLKNHDVFNVPGTETSGFVYLGKVSPQSAVKEPAKTTIGYLLGPGGRALIYADGHVEWEEDKPGKR